MPSFTQFLTLAALAATLATGFIIPDNKPDGMYIADLTTGEVQLLQASESSTNTSTPTATTQRRRSGGGAVLAPRTTPLPVSDSGCPPAGLNAGDYLGAYSNFAAWCNRGNKIGGGKVAYFQVGSAVWYGCSYGGENPCDGAEVSDAESRFNTKCGVAQAAWVYMGDWKKTYGRDVATAEICGNL